MWGGWACNMASCDGGRSERLKLPMRDTGFVSQPMQNLGQGGGLTDRQITTVSDAGEHLPNTTQVICGASPYCACLIKPPQHTVDDAPQRTASSASARQVKRAIQQRQTSTSSPASHRCQPVQHNATSLCAQRKLQSSKFLCQEARPPGNHPCGSIMQVRTTAGARVCGGRC